MEFTYEHMLNNSDPKDQFLLMLLEQIESLEKKQNELEQKLNATNKNQDQLKYDFKVWIIKLIIAEYQMAFQDTGVNYYNKLLDALLVFINHNKKITIIELSEDIIKNFANEFSFQYNDDKMSKLINIFYQIDLSTLKEFHTFDRYPDFIVD